MKNNIDAIDATDWFEKLPNGSVCKILLGRIVVGNHVGRLFFGPDGKTTMLIEKAALEDGSLVLLNSDPAVMMSHKP